MCHVADHLGYRGREIVDALREAGSDASTGEVARLAGVSWTTALITLGRLAEAGKIRRTKGGFRSAKVTKEARWSLDL